jgi:hypothetical protein
MIQVWNNNGTGMEQQWNRDGTTMANAQSCIKKLLFSRYKLAGMIVAYQQETHTWDLHKFFARKTTKK